MHPNLLRLLLHGYGLALAGAAALAFFGLDPMSAALVFWLGGAAATLGLGARLVNRAGPARVDEGDSDEAFGEALRRWEADRLDESSAAREADADPWAAGLHGR